jgi:transcriptional regulator with XRE-family HTH domain
MTLGERILILRRRQGMTQQQLAKEAGLNKNTIARLEQGNLKDLGGRLVAKLAQALGTSTDYLLGLTDESGVESELLPAVVA